MLTSRIKEFFTYIGCELSFGSHFHALLQGTKVPNNAF